MRRRALVVPLALAIWCQTLGAQGTCNANVGTKCTTTITVPTPNASSISNPLVVSLTVTPLAGTWTVNTASLDAGTSDAVPVTMTVQANRTWTVKANGASSWTVSSGGWTAKPTGNANWSTTSTGGGTALTTTGVTLASGTAGTSSTTLYFSTRLSWATDSPATYTMPLSFTVASP